MESIMSGVKVLNDGNPMRLDDKHEGYLFTVSPSTAKRRRGYFTDKQVKLTEYEKKIPGVVVGQNRGMLFSSARPISGKHTIPDIRDINYIIVPEVSRKLFPVDDDENKIAWVGNGEHAIKDVIADGQGQHWFDNDLWMKWAGLLYGVKGMIQPGLATDIGCKVVDYWGVERTITKGNTVLLPSSMVKGLSAYNSLEDLIKHGEMWGLTTLLKQWQSGDHTVENVRMMGTQPQATNLQQTDDEITELLKPEARQIWAMKFEEIAWRNIANINTSRGRAYAACPDLIYNNLVMNQIDTLAGNKFLRIARGQVKLEGRYLKMYVDKLAFSKVYVHNMDPNEAAKEAAATGLHGKIRVNPSFAGRKRVKDENGNLVVTYKKETHLDKDGRFIQAALVRYPHGAPSETIIENVYLDETVPDDVIMFPVPVANDDETIPVKILYAFRLQGADFDGDAVTAFTNKTWIESQKRNIGKSYMVIPVNTESTEKDKTLVTDETWESFCLMKVDSLTNQVGLIATSLKYFMSQCADRLRNGMMSELGKKIITEHACAMGDDIDEFKHGKAKNNISLFIVPGNGEAEDEFLFSPYFNRYAKKYKSYEDFCKAVYTKKGNEKRHGNGSLDRYAANAEKLMAMSKLPIVAECTKASDGKDRYYYTVHPVQWKSKDVELFRAEHGEGHNSVALPTELEETFNVKPGTVFTAKELFLMLYHDHSTMCKAFLEDEECADAFKRLIRIKEHNALAKVAIVAWTKAMKLDKTGEEITAEEAIKIFTTLMTQHTKNSRSIIEVLCQTGTFVRVDGSLYEKTVFSAQRVLNYFLDLCGDGILLTRVDEPNFPSVSETIIKATGAERPDIEKAIENAKKSLKLIDMLIPELKKNVEEVATEISKDELNNIVDDSSMWIGGDDDEDYADRFAEFID